MNGYRLLVDNSYNHEFNSTDFEYYLNQLKQHGKKKGTLENKVSGLRKFDIWLNNPENYDEDEPIKPSDLSQSIAAAYFDYLNKEADLATSTAKNYLSYVDEYYKYMRADREWENYTFNPFYLVRENSAWTTEESDTKPDIGLAEIRKKIQEDVTHPRHRLVFLLFITYGLRIGEMCNLDTTHVTIDYPYADEHLGETHPELDGKQDMIYIPSNIIAGEAYNGEIREEGNKRDSASFLPLTEEVKTALMNYLLIRPQDLDTNALIVNKYNNSNPRYTQQRFREQMYNRFFEPWGWRDMPDGVENVTPHHFRHFFTTHFSRRGRRETMYYIRGKAGETVEDVTYIHDHWDTVYKDIESDFLENIYTLTE